MAHEVREATEFTFTCPLPEGLHARPASLLSEVANRFASDGELTNLRTGASANLKSVLALIAADVRAGDECTIHTLGADEAEARAALRRFVERELPACDERSDLMAAGARSVALPRALRPAGVNFHRGLSASRGVGRGRVVVAGGGVLPREFDAGEEAQGARHERGRVERATAAVRARIGEMLARGASPTESAILKAHLAMLEDVSLASKVEELIAQGHAAGRAVSEAGEFFVGVLRRSESEYIRERAADMEDICLQLLEEICGTSFRTDAVTLIEPSTLVAETLAPQQLLALDRSFLKALVLESAGTTSHTVILARSFNVPTLVGVRGATRLFARGQDAIVDANRGLVVSDPTPEVARFYVRESETLRRREAELMRRASSPAMTTDGRAVEVAANVSSAEEARAALAGGADGVGLFRTEMLFAGRDSAPTEEEQFEVYASAARAAGGRPVIVRTLDAGGDKPLAYLNLAREANPFLGVRGVRAYAGREEMLRAQLRAILRASAFGRVWLMIPMVSSAEEVVWFKARLAEARAELSARGVAHDASMPVGVMIEVPSVAFALGELSAEVEFFSVGTNDLSQYFFAAARDNADVSGIADVRHPAFLRLLGKIVADVRGRGKWVGMCGEMAGDARLLPLAVGLGLDEISAASPEIPSLKEKLSRLSAGACEELLSRALTCRTVEEVEALLARAGSAEEPQPLLDRRLIVLEGEAESKEEAIRALVDELHVAGRTDDRDRLEEAVWAREATYSTGLGHGFAVPHCKSDAVAADTLAVLRLERAVEWGALDGEPVRVVILMAMRETGEAASRHLRVFARLARRLMDEEFRARVAGAGSAQELFDYLSAELGTAA